MKPAVFLLMALTGAWAWSGWAKFINEFHYLPPEYLASLQFKEDLTILMLVTAVPVVFGLYFRQWGKFRIWTWWLLATVQLAGLWVFSEFFVNSGPVSLDTGRSLVPAFAVAVLLVLVLSPRSEPAEYSAWQMGVELGMIPLLIAGYFYVHIYPIHSHHGAPRQEISTVQLALQMYSGDKSSYPPEDDLYGGTDSRDLLIREGYLTQYPSNKVEQPDWEPADFFWQHWFPMDFIDLELLPEDRLRKWKERAEYDPETGKRRMVNVRSLYHEVWRRFRDRKKQGEIPADVEHPFAGHFMYIKLNPAPPGMEDESLVLFGPSEEQGKDVFDSALRVRGDGKADGVEMTIGFNLKPVENSDEEGDADS